MCGTPNYLAPEMLSTQLYQGHSFEIDVWAIGVITYLLLYGRAPFDCDEINQIYKRIKSVSYDLPESNGIELVSGHARRFI